MSARKYIVFILWAHIDTNFVSCQENFENTVDGVQSTGKESSPICPIHGHKNSWSNFKSTQFSKNGESPAHLPYFEDSRTTPSNNVEYYQVVPPSYYQLSQDKELFYVVQPEEAKQFTQVCNNCKNPVELSREVEYLFVPNSIQASISPHIKKNLIPNLNLNSEVFLRRAYPYPSCLSLDSQGKEITCQTSKLHSIADKDSVDIRHRCSNPNCNCKNCKCQECQCPDKPRVCRDTRKLKQDPRTCKCDCKVEKSSCDCQCQQNSGCRIKRHADDFGNFFTNLIPKQFKDFRNAVTHMTTSKKQQKFNVNESPQKFSLLNHLQDLHKKNNPKSYNQPKLGQKYSIVNDFPQNFEFYEPGNRFETQNMKHKFPPVPSYRPTLQHLPMKQNSIKPEYPVNPILGNKYQKLKKDIENNKNTPKLDSLKKSNFFVRSNAKNGVDETILLRKLKKLNGNFLNQNLKDQATNFMKTCLVPNAQRPAKIKFGTRNGGEDDDDIMRRKRTIILSSDELDLPPHYEVELVSDEEQPEDEFVGSRNNDFYGEDEEEGEIAEQCSCEDLEEIQSYEQLQGYHDYPQNPILQQTNPIYQQAPVLQHKYQSIFSRPPYKPVVPPLLKPDVIIGKNVIKKAVQEELNNYHKKVEREQKLKELKQKKNQPFGYGKNGIPQNPMFMLFNAPVDFLRQFHNLNQRSINPVMTTLPNLVYTAKKYFRNFGKDFKNNCMNLASNIIGDFDNVNPNVIQSIVKPNFQKRYRREANVFGDKEPNSKSNKSTEDKNAKEAQNFRHGLGTKVKNKLNHATENIIIEQPEDTNSCEIVSDHKEQKKDEKKCWKMKMKKTQNNRTELADVSTENQSTESSNFRKVRSSSVRKKRYVIKVVNSDEVQSHVEEYLTQKLNFKPLFQNRFSANKPAVQPTHTQQDEAMEDYDYFLESSEEKPSKKKIQIKKVKPRVIIDNKGLAFMEYNGIKRPLLFKSKKQNFGNTGIFNKKSSEEVGNGKIDLLIQRAKEHTDLVGNTQSNIVPQKVIKERITHLLDEIDHLVNLKLEDYDKVSEDLIKIHQIKISIEEDWKRLLITNKIDDIGGKIAILGKLKDLQNVKNQAIKHIGETLQKNNNEFVRKFLISILAKLQRLQSLITGVIDDYETRFQMKIPFNTKKEIKFVDYLSELKFITEKTRNDLVKSIGKKRDEEVQRDIDILNKLKKLLHIEEADSEKFENTAKIIWEMMNACKMQKDTVKEMNKKLSRNQNVKKELKILFDLQTRFDEANAELQESLGGLSTRIKLDNEVVKKGGKPEKKNIKDILAEIKKKQEEWLKKFKKQ